MTFKKGTARVAEANSYADFADYVSLLDDLGADGAELSTLDQSTVEGLLIQATRWIDGLCFHGFPLLREDRLSALALPLRAWQVASGSRFYPRGFWLPDDIPNPEDMIPEIITATCLVADDMRILGGSQQPTDPNDVKRREEVFDDYQVDYSAGANAVPVQQSYPRALQYLTGIAKPGGLTLEVTS